MEPAQIEPATSCLQSSTAEDPNEAEKRDFSRDSCETSTNAD
jgi:hypothetical protein